MQARPIATAQKQSILAVGSAQIFGTPTPPPRATSPAGPTLCSGAGVSSLQDPTHENIIENKYIEPQPATAATSDARLSAREVVTDLGKGAWSTIKGIGTTFKAHPMIATSISVGIAAALFEFPILGTVLLAFGIGSSLWDVGKGVAELRKGMKDKSKVEEDRGIEEVGAGLLGLACSSVSIGLGARPTLALTGEGASAASRLNPGMLFHSVDDLPNLFAAASKREVATRRALGDE
jgi:hypothetical protein